jgi:hypothetical protein
MVGLVAGSYLYAECSAYFKETIDSWGDKGKITLHTAFRMNVLPSVALVAFIVIGALVLLRTVNV